MTQIVLVSHSKAIAEGTKELLEQMASGVTIVAQGGVDGAIGTSYDHIQTLINELDDDALCFYDIGSAEMNLDLAIEMYEGTQRVVKVDSPIVEGSFTAAVKLSVGASIDDTLDELTQNFG
ncbi:dihydroxyacetone kinase phosphoryl donor subunit DhaM [Staphylococcus caeli]|uniref:dihydroxyacetone kinase phosphoryl donor subunit DhaM n=1 Tax=Staphylococcus caeli TaxID=2201815 RepID=UPI003F55561C